MLDQAYVKIETEDRIWRCKNGHEFKYKVYLGDYSQFGYVNEPYIRIFTSEGHPSLEICPKCLYALLETISGSDIDNKESLDEHV